MIILLTFHLFCWMYLVDGNVTSSDTDGAGDVTSLHLVTTMLLRRESSWKNEDEPISWITSPLLEGIKKTVYSPDQYVHAGHPHRNLIMKSKQQRPSVLKNSVSLTPWMSLFHDLNLTKHDIEVLPIVNPGKAAECAGYFTYIIDNYDRLSNVTFFLHGYPFNHNFNILDHVNVIKSWRPDRVGFTHLNNQEYVTVSFKRLHEIRCAHVMELLDLNINVRSISEETAIAGQCCGQFAVMRERVLAIPLDWFVLARKLVYEGQCCYCFEYLWHFIFGEPAIMPPGATSTAKGHFKVHKM